MHRHETFEVGSAVSAGGTALLLGHGWVVIAGAVLATLLCNPLPARVRGQQPEGGAIPTDKPLPHINPDGWTSSAICAECHQAIHAVWRRSLHASSWANNIFQAGLRRSREVNGEEKSRRCFACHAPTVRHGNDYEAKEPITKEGITCDFCHSIQSVELTDPTDPIRCNVGKTKYGPLRHAQSPAHQIVNSDLFKHSELCAGCHEYKNSYGVTVLGTYGEWKGSSYAARGTQCQDCHMPLIPGRTVSLDVKSETNGMVNLHDISGSHDIEKVRKAVTLEFGGYDWLSDKVWVFLKVTNEGSGHCFPTGLPMHRAVLEVKLLKGDEVVGEREIAFEAVMLDEDGRVLQREHEVFIKAAKVRSDTRLKPNESRSIEISFRDVKASRLVVAASLFYEYSTETLVTDEKGERIEPAEMKFLLASCKHSLKPLGQR